MPGRARHDDDVPMTLHDLIDRSAARLTEAGVAFGHGTTNAFDEAAWLVLWKLGLPLDDLDGVAGRALTAEDETGIVKKTRPIGKHPTATGYRYTSHIALARIKKCR